MSLHTPVSPVPPMSEFDQCSPTDPIPSSELLVELVLQLRPLLPDDCGWLEEGAIELAGDYPVDAGEFANILLGVRGNQRVAVKHYRIFSSSNYFPTYKVNGLRPVCSLSC